MHLRRALALVGAVTAGAFAACKDVPFAPHWDADMYLPLSTRSIYLNQFFTFGFIPPNTSGNVSFRPQQQDVTGAIADVLKNLVTDPGRCHAAANPALSCDVLTLTLTKQTVVSSQDTLFIAPDSLGLTVARPGGVVFPVALNSSDLSVTSLLNLSPASVTMLQQAATTKTPLWIQLRGKVTNTGSGPLTITSADSIGIALSVTARIAVSH